MGGDGKPVLDWSSPWPSPSATASAVSTREAADVVATERALGQAELRRFKASAMAVPWDQERRLRGPHRGNPQRT